MLEPPVFVTALQVKPICWSSVLERSITGPVDGVAGSLAKTTETIELRTEPTELNASSLNLKDFPVSVPAKVFVYLLKYGLF